MPIKSIIKELVILFCVSIFTAFAVNAVSLKGIALIGDWDTSQGVITAKPKDDPVSRDLEIGDIQRAREVYDSGDAVFVDARSEEDFSNGHISGAVSFPAYEFEKHIEAFKNNYPPFLIIVTYCSGRECDDSHVLARRLLDEGYTDVRVFVDGYPEWEEKGYPVER